MFEVFSLVEFLLLVVCVFILQSELDTVLKKCKELEEKVSKMEEAAQEESKSKEEQRERFKDLEEMIG